MSNASNIIWIDQNVHSQNREIYVKELESIKTAKLKLFTAIDEAIIYLKEIKFEDTKVIVSGRFFEGFVRKFQENINDMHVAPKIIVFTRNRERFLEFNPEYYSNKFYSFGGIAIWFKEVKEFFEKDQSAKASNNSTKQELGNNTSNLANNSESEIRLTFDCVDSKEKLLLPLKFKSLIDNALIEDITNFTKTIYDTYSDRSTSLKGLLGPIISIPNIPVEIISKYYARAYTAISSFHTDVNYDLCQNKIEKYMTLIKTFYEAVKLSALPLAHDNILYRGALMSKEEIIKIKSYRNNKNKDLPSSIVFCRSFLSFTKLKSVADYFLGFRNKNQNLTKVLFILEKDDSLGYNLATHGDIEKISFLVNEKEVLFFPFSSFAIQDVKENVTNNNENICEIYLLYLGKYLNFIENDEKLSQDENIIEESEFKIQLIKSGLVNEEKMRNTSYKILYNKFKDYENEIEINQIKKCINNPEIKLNNTEKKEIENDEELERLKLENQNMINNNRIIGEILITSGNRNKPIKIINSYENVVGENPSVMKKDGNNYNNEEEIKNNLIIKINGEKIDFTYEHTFKKEGKFIIEYAFINHITKMDYLFFGCESLINLDFFYFKNQNATNMAYMFYGCKSLTNINLSNFNTQNVTDMEYMFYGCKSLITINLSNFKTQNVTNMKSMFYDCQSLNQIYLSNFNTQKVTNMESMFFGCQTLNNINLSNFDTQKVTNMEYMFYDCKSLTNLQLSNFKTENVTNIGSMFHGCTSLNNINVSNFDTQNVTNMGSMFYGCESLNNINLSNFNTQKVTDMGSMFYGCQTLTSIDLSNFKTQNVTNMIHMFYGCKSLTNIDLSNFNTQNVSNIESMFYGCESLKTFKTNDDNLKELLNRINY